MKKVFMFAGSSNCFHVWAELANQINSAIDDTVEYYVLCDEGADYANKMPFDLIKDVSMQPIILAKPNDFANHYESKVTEEKESAFKKIKRFLRKRFNFFYIGLQALVRIKKINGQKAEIRALFKQHKPDAALFVDGIRMGYELATIKVSRDMKIPAIFAPFGCFMSPDAAVYFGVKFPRVETWQQKTFWFKYISRKYSENVGHVGDIVIMRYEIPDMIAMAFTGTAPYSPWYPGGNEFDFVGIAEQQAFDDAKANFDEKHSKKLHMMRSIERTGVLKTYAEKEKHLQNIRTEYGFGEGTLTVIAGEAIAEASYSVGYEEALKIYKGIVESLRETYDYVLLSLHPRMSRDKYAMLEEIPGCKIANERLYKIIALADCTVVFVPKFSPILMVEGIPLSVVDITIEEFESILTDEGRTSFAKKIAERKDILNRREDAKDVDLPDFYTYVVSVLKHR
ncbi:MAG: hypothetical protein MJ107_00980 [Lachnospiraceae bacterium]|nr:hypothetical protein [Lachnospiraceae bacterium]